MAVNRPPTLGIGTKVIDRYLVIAVVGQGGLGTVYQVRDERVHAPQTLALKETFDLSEGARKQFEMEARWLEKLDHPNIPRVRQYFQWHNRLYLVMDFVAGENLELKLIRNGQRPLPELDVLRWVHPISDALAYMHNQNPPLIHRDVKPANIIVTPNGRPALVDLGIAKELMEEQESRTATFIRKAGTEGYAPPEQYAGKGTTGPHSDVYSLGATMYHLLTGQVPASAVERATLDSQLIAPRKLNPMLMPEVEAIMMRSLAIRPSDRFATMYEMERAIGDVLQRAAASPFPTTPNTSGPLRQSFPPTQMPSSSNPPSVSARAMPPSVPFMGPPSVPNGTLPHMELAPTILRNAPQPVPSTNGHRRGPVKAIVRPRRGNHSANGSRSDGSSLTAPATSPASTLPPAASAPQPRARRAQASRRGGFPWRTIAVILAVVLVIGGIVLGTHDYWSYLFASH
jgi:serine/threonine-protein kinase